MNLSTGAPLVGSVAENSVECPVTGPRSSGDTEVVDLGASPALSGSNPARVSREPQE